MNSKTMTVKGVARLAVVMAFAVAAGGCATYHQSYYPDSGVYYGASGGYGHAAGYSRGGYYGRVNPVDYPYWSIDHFYFSQYHHPYSVYVGYHQPLYYPYPGWALARHRPLHARHAVAFGFGYPWHGYGYRYPAYSFGFFASYSSYHRGSYGHRNRHDHHRIRDIDHRLQALQGGDVQSSRRALLTREAISRGGSGQRQDFRRAPRLQSREALLRGRDARADAAHSTSAERSATLRDRRGMSARASTNASNRATNSNEIRRRSAADGHRGIPIENLRGRVIVNSRSRAVDGARGEGTRSDRSVDRNVRSARSIDWGRSERASRSRVPEPSVDTRRRVLNRADTGAPPSNTRSRASYRQAPPPRAERSAPPSRVSSPPRQSSRSSSSSPSSSAPSRRDLMRKRSGDNR